ncbi:MAG TPA: serine endoprotease DegQ, partial [Methylococcales bacterium]
MNTQLVKQLLSISILAVCFSTPFTLKAAGLPPYVDGQPVPSLAPMLERAMPAVVNISTSTHIQVSENPLMQDPFFREFFNVPEQLQRQQKNSLGSGVIIDSSQGLVLTNNHVIDKADKI